MYVSIIQFKDNTVNSRNRVLKNTFGLNTLYSGFSNFNKENPKTADTFIKSNNLDAVSFTSSARFVTKEFETKFTKQFFKRLLREGITDAYSDIIMIPQENIDFLKHTGALNKRSSIAIKELKKYKNNMFPIEKEIFYILENLSKKHPTLNLQELIKLKYSNAEQVLIKQQSNVLNKISLIIRKLPKVEYLKVRALINESFDKIFAPNPLPEERFGRKNFIYKLKTIEITDKSIKKKLTDTADKLPQSSDSINAFIVKYSQPYKLIYNPKTQSYIRIPRNSEELGMRLLTPSVGTDDHIHPQKAYLQEKRARENGDESAMNLSTLRVSILTTRRSNEEKSDIFIDDFIKIKGDYIITNIENHINRLIQITEKWFNHGRIQEASELTDYIQTLQSEFARRSKKVKIELGDFEDKISQIKERAAIIRKKQADKKLLKPQKADNYSKNSNDGTSEIFENRKVQKYIARYKQ